MDIIDSCTNEVEGEEISTTNLISALFRFSGNDGN